MDNKVLLLLISFGLLVWAGVIKIVPLNEWLLTLNTSTDLDKLESSDDKNPFKKLQ